MMGKKKRTRVGYGPMGTPGMGPPRHHKSAQHGSGRLVRAIDATRKDAGMRPPSPRDKAANAPSPARTGKTAAKTAPAGAKAARSTAKAAAPPQGSANRGGKHSGPSSPPAGEAKRKAATGNSARQNRAKSAAQRSRTKQGGLGSRRLGHVSARGKRAQARRDSKR